MENSSNDGTRLTWFPWIGKNYFTSPRRIMVLGESHYSYVNHSRDDIEKDLCFTCDVVSDYVKLGKDAGNQCNTYDPMTDVLRGTLFPLSASGSDVWDNVAYMNIIQKCMDDKDGNKNWQDFLNGWKVVLQVINILKPQLVVCFSSDKQKNRVNFNRLNEFNTELHINYDVTPCGDAPEKIERTTVATPGSISLLDDGILIPVIFLRHASRIKNIKAWRNVLHKYAPKDFLIN